MNTNTFSKLSLTLITVSLLTACGGGGNDNNGRNNSDNNNNSNIATGSNTIPNTSTGTADQPSLSLNGANPQQITLGSAFADQGARATDAVDGNLSADISQSNNVNTAVAGCYQQTYVVSDTDGNSNSLTRTVLVGNDAQRHTPNTAPITQEVAISSSYNSVSTIKVLEKAFDADCDALTISNISTPDVGTATINDDGTVTFNPQGNVGSHYFTYTVSDNYGGSSTSGVSIASVDPDDGNDNWPDISNETVSIPKNTSILIDVLDNDFDADGDVLVLDGVDQPQHGTIEKAYGQVFYTPDADFTGEDFFYYGVHDGFGHNGSGLTTIFVTE